MNGLPLTVLGTRGGECRELHRSGDTPAYRGSRVARPQWGAGPIHVPCVQGKPETPASHS